MFKKNIESFGLYAITLEKKGSKGNNSLEIDCNQIIEIFKIK